ncbi:MAG: hypothetical protein AB1489_12070 [Acidobacteriota bacterium]
MRKIWLTLLSILCLFSIARATEITVAQQTIDNWQYGGTTAELRIYADRAFITGGSTGAGKIIQAGAPPAGKFYKKITITINGTTATIPMFVIDSTRDGQDVKTARYNCFFFSADGRQLGPYEPFQNIQIPATFDTGAMTTWAAIAVYNRGAAPIPAPRYVYDDDTIDRLLAAVNSITNPLTTKGDIIVAGTSGALARLGVGADNSFLIADSTQMLGVRWSALTSSHITTALGYTPLNRAGDTMTGFLTLVGNPTQSNHAASKGYVDALFGGGGITNLNGLTATTQTFAVGAAATGFLSISSSGSTHTFNIAAPLSAIRGGTGLGSFSTGDLIYANSATTLAALNIGAANRVLVSSGSAPQWVLLDLTASVTGILPVNNGGTGNAFTAFIGPTTSIKTFTLPNSSATILTTATAVTAQQGGTGIASYTVGDLLYADSTTTLAKRAIGANNTVLRVNSGLPTWGAVALSTDVSGLLGTANGGTGVNLSTGVGYLKITTSGQPVSLVSTPLPNADIISAPTINGVVYAGASSPATTAIGASGTILVGTGGAPAFSASPTITSLTISGLTTGSMPFVSAGGLITQNNARLSWDNTNFRLSVQGEVRLLGSTSGYIGLVAPATVTSYTLRFPTADGTNGQVLATDGTGNLTFVNQAGGGGGGGISSINGLTASIQTFSIGSSGADFNISSVSSTHTFNIPSMAATGISRGLLTDTTQTLPGDKILSGNTTLSGATTLGNTINFAAGTTAIVPARFQASSLLSTPVSYSLENDTVRLYYTNSSGVRKSIAHLDDNVAGFTGNLAGDISGTMSATSYNGIVPANKGGTGAALTFTIGDFLYANSTTTLARVGGNTSTTKMFLSQTGTAGVPNAPAWSLIDLGTSDVTGILTLNKGGLGASLTIGTAGSFLRSDGTVVSFSTDGSALTSLNASNISSGTIADARLSTNVQLKSEKDAASGYAGLTTSTKLNESQGQEVWDITDLTDYSAVFGTGSHAIRATFTSLAAGDIIQWNGANFVNVSMPSGTNHNILSPTHTDADTAAGSITLGDLFTVVDTDPGVGVALRWSRLAIGAANTVLVSTGTVPMYTGTPTLSSVTLNAQSGLILDPYGTNTGNTAELRFKELAAGGTNYIGFKAPDTITSNVIWVLPADNSNGVLRNNGGVLSWDSTMATAGGWTDDGTTVRLTTATDSVAIGSSTPISSTMLSLVQGTLTSDQQALGTTYTWNSSSTTFTALKFVLTNTASDANSKFIDYKIGSNSRFVINRDGAIMADSDGNGSIILAVANASGGLAKKIFRGTTASAWLEAEIATFFQVGDAGDKIVIQTASGNAADRLMLSANSTYITDVFYTSVQANATKLATLDVQQANWSSGLTDGRTIARFSGGVMTGQTPDTEAIDFHLDIGRTVTFLSGAGTFTEQKAVWIERPTYAFSSADTIATAATVAIQGAPLAGTNATITTAIALWVKADVTRVAGFATGYATKNANYTATVSDNFITVDAGTSGVTITLISAASVPAGFEITIKKIAGSGSVTIDPNGSQEIDDDSTSRILTAIYSSLTLVSDGDEWYIK